MACQPIKGYTKKKPPVYFFKFQKLANYWILIKFFDISNNKKMKFLLKDIFLNFLLLLSSSCTKPPPQSFHLFDFLKKNR